MTTDITKPTDDLMIEKPEEPLLESPKAESPKAVTEDDIGTASTLKSMLGMKTKKPRAEYQAEIDELKEENQNLRDEIALFKKWLASAP